MTLLINFSAFGDSIPPLFISKNKTFGAKRLAEQQPFHGHDYLVRSAEKTFITDVLFGDWPHARFIPKNDSLRIKAH
jgi:hypothetical protein